MSGGCIPRGSFAQASGTLEPRCAWAVRGPRAAGPSHGLGPILHFRSGTDSLRATTVSMCIGRRCRKAKGQY